MDMDELKYMIGNFNFDKFKGGSQGFNRILIQLFGLAGNGKSSFINTCIYVWQDGKYQNWAKAMEEDGGVTKVRIPHQLTSNISLVDNRGYGKMDGCETGEIFAQLGNLLPLGREVVWNEGFKVVDRIVKAENLVKSSDFIVPVFVHSVKKVIAPEEISDMKNVFKIARELTGIYPIVVLTHRTYGNLTTVENTFKDMGIERMFAFENYTQEDHFKTRGRHEEVLKFLQTVIADVQFRVEHHERDPVKEMADRKKFVTKYAHEQDMKREEDKLQREIAMDLALRKREFDKEQAERERQNQKRREEEAEELKAKKVELEKKSSVDRARYQVDLPAPEHKVKSSNAFLGIFRNKKKN